MVASLPTKDDIEDAKGEIQKIRSASAAQTPSPAIAGEPGSQKEAEVPDAVHKMDISHRAKELAIRVGAGLPSNPGHANPDPASDGGAGEVGGTGSAD